MKHKFYKVPISNLNNDHFSQDDKDQMTTGWTMIMNVLNKKSRNLSAEERQKFGSINEKNKLVVIKTLDYHTNQPHLDCPDVDYNETRLDWEDRTFMAGFIAKFAEANVICNILRISHDFDAYNAAKDDYDFTKYKMNKESGAGWQSKYKDLLPFFKTNNNTGDEGEDNTDENNNEIEPNT